ncbi:hypothetical protein ACS0TY_004030 [Phlomoides rotata]
MGRIEDEERKVHPDCRNASNPYHECSEYCFMIIADAKKRINKSDTGYQGNDDNEQPSVVADLIQQEKKNDGSDGGEERSDEEAGMNEDYDAAFANLKGRQKRLFELRMKMNEARKANQTAMVAEKKKLEAPGESRGISKQKWLEERKKKIGRLLDANGLDMSKAYMLDTQEMAESKYKKWEKDPAPAGWDVFNQKTLYNAYKKRSNNIEVDHDEYNRLKEADPEFYREASSLQYGKVSINIFKDRVHFTLEISRWKKFTFYFDWAGTKYIRRED